jgi:hypothetical protein
MRTKLGRAIEASRETGADAAMLRRLYGALTDDLYAATARQGMPPYAKTADGKSYDIAQHGAATPRGEKTPDAVYYVKPEHAKLLNSKHRPDGSSEMGFHPMRTVRMATDPNGNKTLAVFRGEGQGQIDGSTKVPFRTKPEQGLVPIEIHDGGMRAKLGAPINEIGVSPGERAANMMRNVDKQYEEMVTTLRKPLQRLYGDNTNPLEAMNKLGLAAQNGDLKTLRAFMRVMTEKDDPVRGVAAIVSHVTKGSTEFKALADGLRTLPPETRSALATTPAVRQWMGQLQNIERVVGRLEKYQAAVTKGGDLALNVRTNQGAVIAALADLPTTIAFSAGASVAARFLASPAYLNRLTRVLESSMTRNPEAMRSSLKRLSATAAADGEIGQQVLTAISSTLSSSPAHATFVGERTRGVDTAALVKAKSLDRDGADREAIWKQTGWFKDGSGEWLTEIDDSEAKLSDGFAGKRDGAFKDRLDKFVKHDKLFAARPDLARMSTFVGQLAPAQREWFGWHDPIKNEIVANSEKNDEGKLLTFIHEGQHGIDHNDRRQYGKYAKNGQIAEGSEYYAIPGEARAYLAEDRLKMTPEERWNTPPWKSLRATEKDIERNQRSRRK